MTRLATLFWTSVILLSLKEQGWVCAFSPPALLDLSPFHMTFSSYLSFGLLDLISVFYFTYTSIGMLNIEI